VVLPQALREGARGEPEHVHHLLERAGQVQGAQVFAHDVLDQGQLPHLAVVHRALNAGNLGQAGDLRGLPAALASSDLVAVAGFTHGERLQDAVRADRGGQPLKGSPVEGRARLRGGGVEQVYGDRARAEEVPGAIGAGYLEQVIHLVVARDRGGRLGDVPCHATPLHDSSSVAATPR